ncbi:MAG: DUF1800 family protein [Bacteroidota bacterium]
MTDFKIRAGQYREQAKRFRKVLPPDSTKARFSGTTSNQHTLDIDAGLNPYIGTFGEKELSHLIKRTHFGVTKQHLRSLSGKSLSEVLTSIIQSDPAPPPPVNDYNGAEDISNDPEIPFGETWIEAPFSDQFEGLRNVSLKSWWLRQMMKQPSTIHQKMILFWHNMLPIQIWDVFIGKASYQYIEMLRRNALGNFKTFIRELTLDPAMLIFLNGAFNNQEAPDENYARELQELFCIGKGLGSAYTEQDVQSAAKVLTGWTLRWETIQGQGSPQSYFEPWLHDTTNKQFSAFYGNKLIEGKEGDSGAEELDELLDMIFDNDETAMHLARRLYSFFVYNSISESAETNVITPLAEIIRANNFDILPAITALLSSEHFFHPEIIGAQIKNPVDFTLAYLRTLGIPMAPRDSTEAFQMQTGITWQMAGIGMEIGDPPNVAGWPAYYQTPQFDKSWITTDSITNRAVQTDSLIFWGFWIGEDETVTVDLLSFLETLDHPEDINLMIEEVSTLLLGLELTQDQIDEIKGILLSGQQNDSYWNTAWIQYQQNSADLQYATILNNRIRPAFQLILQLGESQLM